MEADSKLILSQSKEEYGRNENFLCHFYIALNLEITRIRKKFDILS
jgi:hypothetical protein